MGQHPRPFWGPPRQKPNKCVDSLGWAREARAGQSGQGQGQRRQAMCADSLDWRRALKAKTAKNSEPFRAGGPGPGRPAGTRTLAGSHWAVDQRRPQKTREWGGGQVERGWGFLVLKVEIGAPAWAYTHGIAMAEEQTPQLSLPEADKRPGLGFRDWG